MHKYKFFDHLFHSRAPSFVRNCQSCTSRIPIDLLRTSLWSCIVSCVVYVLTTNRTYELYHHQVQNTPKWFIQFDTLPVLYLVFSLYFLSKSCKFQRRSAPYSANTFCGGFTQSLVYQNPFWLKWLLLLRSFFLRRLSICLNRCFNFSWISSILFNPLVRCFKIWKSDSSVSFPIRSFL